MTLDVALVCPACRRFWHGPGGLIPYPVGDGRRRCTSERHASTSPEPVVEVELDPRVVAILTPEEIDEAYRRGLAVYDDARRKGRTHKFDTDDPLLREKNAESQVAEEAGRRFLGLAAANDLLEPDAGLGDAVGLWEIRHNPRPNGRLCVYQSEPLEMRYLLVSGTTPNQTLRGWFTGAEARVDDWFAEWAYRPSYWVPQSFLHSLESLR